MVAKAEWWERLRRGELLKANISPLHRIHSILAFQARLAPNQAKLPPAREPDHKHNPRATSLKWHSIRTVRTSKSTRTSKADRPHPATPDNSV